MNPYLAKKAKFQKDFLAVEGVETKKFYDGSRVFGPEESETMMSEAADASLRGPISSFLSNFSPDDNAGIS